MKLSRVFISLFFLFACILGGAPKAEAAPQFEEAYRRSQTTAAAGLGLSVVGSALLWGTRARGVAGIAGPVLQIVGMPMGIGGSLRGRRLLTDLNVDVSAGYGVAAWVSGLSSVTFAIAAATEGNIALGIGSIGLYVVSLSLTLGQILANKRAAKSAGVLTDAKSPQRKRVQLAMAPAISKKGGGMFLSGRF